MYRSNPHSGQIYKHYSGNEFLIIEICTDINSGNELVVYRSLQDDYNVWARPLKTFMSTVRAPDGKMINRYTLIKDS